MVVAGHEHQVGALQPVVPVFLQFSGFSYGAHSFDLQRFHEFFSLAMRITHQYQGRLNRISMGDKGSTMLMLFGAPKQIERKEELACQWALDLREQAQKKFPEVRFRIGMTSGRVFSGIVGGSDRFEYTVMGDVVNLAARLMQGAEQNQICCNRDLQTKAENSYRFADLGSRAVKGKTKPVPVFALEDLAKSQLHADKQDFIGRTAEIALIVDHLERARSGTPRMILIEGGAGVGKSFLANRILSLAHKDGWSIIPCRSEASGHGRSYGPWHQVFDSVFFHGKKPQLEDIRALLRSGDESFLTYLLWHLEYFGVSPSVGWTSLPANDLNEQGSLAGTEARSTNMQDSGYRMQDSGYRMQDAGYRIQDEEAKELSGYDVESKKNLLHHQLCVLLLQNFKGNPTLFFLDDLHWFDSLSLDLLLAFLNHLKDQPVLLLATTRPNWQKDKFIDRSTCHYFGLKEMDHRDVKDMAAKLLGANVRDALVHFLYKRTQGNPFFTRQLLDYLKANDLLTSRLGEWTISRNAAVKGGLSGEDVIIARAEHLDVQEKIHLRTAACIGPTFHFPVFDKAMGTNFGKDAFASLCSLGYFQEIGAGEFSFPHALVQETLYHAMPKKFRKKNHREIAFALESIFADNPAPYYAQLATHYFEAGVHPKAIDYSTKAGNQLYDNLSYPEACHFLQRSYDLLKRAGTSTKLDVGIRLGRTLLRTGQVQQSLSVARRLLRLTAKGRSRDAYYLARTLELEAMRRLGDYAYVRAVERALRYHMRIPKAIRDQLMYSLGLAYHSSGKLDAAAKYFKVLLRPETAGSIDIGLSSYMRLAGISSVRGDFEEALRLLSKATELAETRNNPYQALRIRICEAGGLLGTTRPHSGNFSSFLVA